MRERYARLVALATGLIIVGAVLWFGHAQQAVQQRIGAALDPAAWAETYPRHVAAFLRTARDGAGTAHGGSVAYDKLAAKPFRRRAFAGHAFALEYRAARGHHYAQFDQRMSRRTREVTQPGGCINCHAAEAPGLIAAFGWRGLHAMDYDELRGQLAHGMSCADCHQPGSMALRVTRPALAQALAAQGIALERASHRELRDYVCAQCHVEYYFAPEDRTLVLPWAHGRRLEDIERYYDARDFSDWTHAETGARLIKIQHPETELHGQGPHAALGVACADCHLPTVDEDAQRLSDHWIRSPLTQVEAACGDCHRTDAAKLRARVVAIQDATVAQLAAAEQALSALMDAIVAAQAAGIADTALAAARHAQRRAQLRWDFIDAENSTGFHAPAEAARILAAARELALAGTAALNAATGSAAAP